MSWGLLKGLGQGVSAVGGTMMQETLDRQREEWRRAYLEKTQEKQWDREDAKSAAAIEREDSLRNETLGRETAKQVVETTFEKDDEGNTYEVRLNAQGEQVARKQLRPETDLTDRQMMQIEGIDNRLNALREDSIMASENKAEIDSLERRRNDILNPPKPLGEDEQKLYDHFKAKDPETPEHILRSYAIERAKEMRNGGAVEPPPEPEPKQEPKPEPEEPGLLQRPTLQSQLGTPEPTIGRRITDAIGDAVDRAGEHLNETAAKQSLSAAKRSLEKNRAPNESILNALTYFSDEDLRREGLPDALIAAVNRLRQ